MGVGSGVQEALDKVSPYSSAMWLAGPADTRSHFPKAHRTVALFLVPRANRCLAPEPELVGPHDRPLS